MMEPSTHSLTSENLPDRAVFREVVENCLRHFSAYALEAHMIKEHERKLGGSFLRGEELSEFDAEVFVDTPTGSSRFVGMDCKTMVMAYRHDTKINERTGPVWRGSITYSEAQLSCDIWSIYFPMLRQPRLWRAMKNPKEPGFVPLNQRLMVVYQHAEAGQRIDHVVPSPLWPNITTVTQSAQLASALSTGSNLLIPRDGDFEFWIGHGPSEPTSREALSNAFARREHATVEYLRKGFARSPTSSFEIIDVEYRPYTCDFAFRHKDSGLVALVELKIGFCSVTAGSGHEDEITLLHDYCHPNSGPPVFVYSSGRWAYLLSCPEVDGFDVGGICIPGSAAFLHRHEIEWWHRVPDSTGQLRGQSNKSNIVNLKAGFVEQIETHLKRDLASGRFGLPRLEVFTSVPHERLADLFSRAAKQANRSCYREDKSDNTHRPNYKYQAAEALRFLQVCHASGQGLIYDWQHQSQALRTYAFCAHEWSEPELAYTSTRPRRLPKEIFEHSPRNSFILLSFCQFRQHESEDRIYVHPFVLDELKRDYQSDRSIFGRRLLVLVARDLTEDGSLEPPIYAIPDTLMQLELPMRRNRTRYERLQLRENEDLEGYKFDSRASFINYLASVLESLHEEETRASVLDHRLRLTFRREIYEWIKSLGKKIEDDPSMADQETISALEEPEEDFTIF